MKRFFLVGAMVTAALVGAMQAQQKFNPNQVALLRWYQAGANIWVTNAGSNNVTKLSQAGKTLGTFAVTNPHGVAFDGVNIWVANAASGTVSKLLASTGANLGTFSVPGTPDWVAFDGSSIWVANEGGISKL